MRVELIEDPDRFRSLRGEWHGLLEQSTSDCPFLTWEWLHTWWTHFAGGRKLCLLAVRDRGDLIGLAPLAVSPWRVTHFRPFHALAFLGTGSVGSDYPDLIRRAGREPDVAEALARDHSHREEMPELKRLEAGSYQAAAEATR